MDCQDVEGGNDENRAIPAIQAIHAIRCSG
jgi:hypothetical protein